MKSLLESSIRFDGSMEDNIQNVFKLAESIGNIRLFAPFKVARDVTQEFILTAREAIELLSGDKFTPGGPSSNRFLQFIDALGGGNAAERRQEKQFAAQNLFQVGVREQRIAALREQEFLGAKSKVERINILARIENEKIKIAEEELQAARRVVFPTDLRQLPKDLFDILRQNAELRRQNAIDALSKGRGFRFQTFQTPLGIARFGGGQRALDRIADATEKTERNTRRLSGPAN